MAEGKVITGTIIDIQVKALGQSFSIGRAMGLNVQEQYRVMPVYGIGNLNAQELPILQYAGAFTVQQFAVSSRAMENLMGQFKRMGNLGVETLEKFKNHILYNEGIDVTVTRKEKQTDGTILDKSLLKITGAVCTGETMGIQENQIVVRSGDFVFAQPISI